MSKESIQTTRQSQKPLTQSLEKYLLAMKQFSCGEPKWLNSCKQSLKGGQFPKKCTNCVSDKGGSKSCYSITKNL